MVKNIAKELMKNSVRSTPKEGVHDPVSILDQILKDRQTHSSTCLRNAITYIVNNKIDYASLGIFSIWDNTINGRDKDINSYLIRFFRKDPEDEFWIEATLSDARLWKW